MTRLTRLLFPAILALAVLIPSLASAQTKLQTVQVGWHTSLAAYVYSEGDSAAVYRGAGVALETAQPVDTTQSLDIRQFVMPGPNYGTTVASDSISWLRFSLFPRATTPTVAADTIRLNIQVSDDNVNWISTTFSGLQASEGTVPNSVTILETGGSSNTFQFVVRQCLGGVLRGPFFPGLVATVGQLNLFGFKYMRFLVTGDHTGFYDAEVTGFVPQ